MAIYKQNTGKSYPGSKDVQSRDTGSVPLTDDFNGALWHGPIEVGTPPKTFTGIVYSPLGYLLCLIHLLRS